MSDVHTIQRVEVSVCGGLGSLHAVALPSFGEGPMQSAAALRSDEPRRSRRRGRRDGRTAPRRRCRSASRQRRSEDPRIEVALDLTHVDCEDCILPSELLEQMISNALSRQIRGEFELIMHDPRTVSPPA